MDVGHEVTLVMPLYNTMSRVDTGGVPLVDRMMASIAHQDSGSPQVLVLDNQSVDGSVDYLSRTAPSHVPLKVQVDAQQRPPEEAIFQLMKQVDTPFVGIVNDDDALAPTFISALLAAARRSQASLTYPNARWLGLDGATTGSLVPYRGRAYGPFRSGTGNLRRYLRIRNPVPMIFGLWRTPDAQSVFDIHRFDEHSHDLDNLILARTLARDLPVDFVNQPLFFYSVRQGHRSPPGASKATEVGLNPLDLLLANWAHHVKFSCELLGTISRNRSKGATPGTTSMALVISQELRRRLDLGATWALGLAPATREQFALSLRLRQAVGRRTSAWTRVGITGRPRPDDSRRKLPAELERWLALQDCLDQPGWDQTEEGSRHRLSDDVADFSELLGEFA